MYARSTSVRGDPQALGDGMAYVHDKVRPAVLQMDGCVGISMLADKDSGRCIVTTSWADAAALRRSARDNGPLRDRYAEIFRGPTDVHEWEIALMHRACETGDGSCARVTWTTGDPADLDHMVDTYRMTMIPKLEELPGFCSVSLLIDRATGEGATSVTYQSRAALQGAQEAGVAMREEFLRAVNRESSEGAVFDVVLAHLRVPEKV